MLDPDFTSLEKFDRLALAVSGGRDSTALMLLAARKPPSERLHVLTVDHKLRPEAAAEAQVVAGWARSLGLPHTTLEWQGDKPKTGKQAAAREARYRLMADWCRANGYGALVTAHTLDDQAETVLMRLRRGSGVDGLSAMAPQSWRNGLPLMRPLLGVSREELTAYLQDEQHPWIDDPSNDDQAYERINLRKNWHLADQLGLTKPAIARTARKLTRARAALDHAASELLAICAEISDFGACSLQMETLARAAEEIKSRALSRCLQAVGGRNWPPGEDGLERALGWLASSSPSAITLGGCRLAQQRGSVSITREMGRISERSLPLTEGTEQLWDGRFRVAAKNAGPDVLAGPLGAEGWAALKSVRPAIPAVAGRSLPAFRDGRQILAVPSIGYIAPETAPNARFSAIFANRGLIENP